MKDEIGKIIEHVRENHAGDRVLLESLLALAKQALEYDNLIAELAKQASTDSLTGLLNRRYFENLVRPYLRQMEQIAELSSDRRTPESTRILSMLMIDIDHFKQVNDTYGHEVGDLVICEVARLIKKTLRETDPQSRHGGEEFLVALPGSSIEDTIKLGESLRQNVERLTFSGYPDLTVTVSVGVVSTDTTLDFNQMVKCADTALYASKRGGRNRVTNYTAELDIPDKISSRETIETVLPSNATLPILYQ